MIYSQLLLELLVILLLNVIQSYSETCCGFVDDADELEFETMALSDEKRLIKKLLQNYESAGVIGRPVQNTTEKVVVEYGLGLIQILDLDEKNQVLTINVWSRYTWTDQLLRWEPSNYSDVREVRVPPNKIWTPDIVLYNYADERMKEQRDVMVVVDFTGKVMWIPPAIFKSTCKIDIKNFPFDQQACHLKFGSWTYDGFKLDIQFYGNESLVNTKDYTPSNEWRIIARPARRNVKYYPCCVEPYPDLTFFLFLRRNPAFFAYLLVLPCVLLSSLTLVIFWLPPESPAKMVLGMNIFVAFFLLLLLLADSTPSASTSVPYIGYYYCLNMVLITLSTFLSVIVINLYFRGDKRNRLPHWLGKTVSILSRLLCMQQEVCADDMEKLRIIKAEIRHNKRHQERQAMRRNNSKSRFTNANQSDSRMHPRSEPGEQTHLNRNTSRTTATVAEMRRVGSLTDDQFPSDIIKPRLHGNSLFKEGLPGDLLPHQIPPGYRHHLSTLAKHNYSILSNSTPGQLQYPNGPSYANQESNKLLVTGPENYNSYLYRIGRGGGLLGERYYNTYNSFSVNPPLLNNCHVGFQSSYYNTIPLPGDTVFRNRYHMQDPVYNNQTRDTHSTRKLTHGDHPGDPPSHSPSPSHLGSVPNSIPTRTGNRVTYQQDFHTATHTEKNGEGSGEDECYDDDENDDPFATAAALELFLSSATVEPDENTLEENLSEIRRAIGNLMTRISDKDKNQRIAREWRMVALVLDRIFFWFYLGVIILAGVVLLMPKQPTQSIEKVIMDNTPNNTLPFDTFELIGPTTAAAEFSEIDRNGPETYIYSRH